MKNKKVKAILSTLLVSAMIVGCSSGAGPKETTANATAGSAATTVAQDKGKKTTLTFYGFSDWVDTEPFKAVYLQVKEDFEKENPGFTVELQSDSWGDWEQKYKTMFASGNPADIFMVNNPDFPVFANSGNLLDLGAYADKDYFDQFFPGVLGMYQWKDKNMAVPFTTDCRILWYNKDIFTEAGLDPNKPPTTWEELVSYAKQITEKTGKYGFGMDMGLAELPTASLYCASGSQLVNVDSDGKITPNVDTPEFRAYLQTLVDMKGTYEPDYPNLDHHDVANQYVEGQFGMIIGNTLTATDIYEKDFYAQALVPSMTASTPKGSFGGGFGICVSSQTKAPAEAVKFAQMLCDAKYNAGLVSDLPASDAGLANSSFATDARFKTILEQIQYVTQSQPKTLYYAEIEAAAYDTVVGVVVGGKDIDTAIVELGSKIEEIVKE